MNTKSQVEISRDTIEVFSSFTKVNKQFWITSGQKQSVVSPSSSILFVAQIKENIPAGILPTWGNEKGFGIFEGGKFVKTLQEFKKPILDFSDVGNASIIILDKTNSNKKVVFPLASPVEIKKQTKPVFMPDMDLVVKFNWDEITQMKKMGEKIEISKLGKEEAIFKNLENNNSMSIENTINDYTPKSKKFRFVFLTGQLQIPQGNYKVSFSESGISEWVNTTDRRFIFYMALDKGCWFDKPKTPTQLMSMKPTMKPVKNITTKEYKNINDYSKAIQITWRKGVDAIIETGELLLTAKEKFSKNEMVWQSFLNNLPFGERTIDRLIYISKYKDILLDDRIYNNLPPSWSTLYEICTIGNEQPITIYENDSGEKSKVKKDGFAEITMEKKDFILQAIDERVSTEGKRVPVLRADMTRKDIDNFKRKIAFEYFDKEQLKKDIEPREKEKVFKISFKPDAPQTAVINFQNELNKLIQNNSWVSVQNN
jgi:hypothetical protein